MKILFITAEGFDTPNPNNQMAEVMINDFLDRGYQVHLIQSHRKGINPDIPKSIEGRDDFTHDTIMRMVVDKSSFVKRYFNDLKYHFDSYKRWKKVNDADIIYLQSNPTIYVPIWLIKRRFKKTPIVYSIYDVFPGHAYDIGVIKNKTLYNVFKWLQKPCYRKVSAITVLSEDMKDIVVGEGANADDVYVVPAWYDVKTTSERPKYENRFIQKYNISTDKFVCQYAGSLGYVFNYKTILELAARLKEKDKNILVEVIGDGPIKDIFIKEAKDRGLDNIEFYPLQPVELVPDVYSACDCEVIPLKKGVIGNGTPSKAPILMACKRLIINSVEAWSKYSKSFKEHNMGLAVDVEDYDGLADAVCWAKNHPKEVNVMKENALAYVRDNFSSTISLNKLSEVLEKYSRES